jgi:hypothetical protein
MIAKIYYRVATFREAGLDAKWSKSGAGKPCIVAKVKNSIGYYVVTAAMFKRMQKVGVSQGFEEFTILGNAFSIGVWK